MLDIVHGSMQNLWSDIIVIYRKNESILISISLKRYFSHPE